MTDKTDFDMKAELLTSRRINRWLGGEIGRRVLVIPFGGPLPGGKAGLDLDGEYFDEETDLYGPYPALKASKWRLMDWHHDDFAVPSKVRGGPTISMKGTVIGEIELDDDPDEFGHWANWWIRQGQANDAVIGAKRVAALQEMGAAIYGSSQAVPGATRKSEGHIEVWPIYRHTASTAPRNTYAAIPPIKAFLDDLSPSDLSTDAMKALVVGLSDLVPDLRATFSGDGETLDVTVTSTVNLPLVSGEPAAKAGRVLSAKNEASLRSAIEALGAVLGQLERYAKQDAAEDAASE